MNVAETVEIPTISLTGLRSGDRADLERIGAQIGAAARGLGFFSVSDHGIAPELVDAAFAASRAFFALPEAEKQALSVANSTAYRGYVRIGEEKLDPSIAADVKECFNAGPDLAADDPDVLAGKPFHAVNQWPDLPGFLRCVLHRRGRHPALAALPAPSGDVRRQRLRCGRAHGLRQPHLARPR
jgi:isopenicillin N synthase-like dioxygenase